MEARKLVVGITGDTGWDLYTHYSAESADPAQSWHDHKSIADLYVPAGARFAAIALDTIFGNAIEVRCFVPTGSNKLGTSTFPNTTLVFVNEFESQRGIKRPGSDKPVANRIHRFAPFPQAPETHITAPPSTIYGPLQSPGAAPMDVCLVHEACGTWIAEPKAISEIQNMLERKRDAFHSPRVIVNLNNALPKVEIDETGRAVFSAPFWKMLAGDGRGSYEDQVCVICSATMLRHAGARLSWRLSWEQTIEDLASDLIHFDQLRALSRFRHLIIRFGVVAAIHVETHGRNRSATLTFAPLAKDGVYRDRKDDGEIIGKNTLLATALIDDLVQTQQNPGARKQLAFTTALRRGLLANMRMFDHGYGEIRGVTGEDFAREFVKVGKSAITGVDEKEERDQTIRTVHVPPDVIQRPPQKPPGRRPIWQILGDQIDGRDHRQAGHENEQTASASRVSRINLGIAIALYGHDNVINRDFVKSKPALVSAPDGDAVKAKEAELRFDLDQRICEVLTRGECEVSAEETADYITLPHHHLPLMPHTFPQAPTRLFSDAAISAPVIQFGNLLTIERSDIETFRSIHNLIKNYVEQEGQVGAPVTPISIAVFGPPGSGKSFAVKQIARSMKTSGRSNPLLEEIEYNVAQFRSIDDLGEAVMRLTSVRAQGKIPLVFFDEFDCTFRDEQLGWLKYFLAPMQDGTFYGARQTIEFGRAIFVFAGGVYNSFDEFDPTSERRVPSTGHGFSEEFKQRLMLFKAQKGPDFVSRLRGHIDVLSINTSEGQTKHITRRAIVIRSLIEKQELTKIRCGCAVGEIDEDVLFALLTVDRYRHGTRSLEAILQMCTPIDGKIEKTSLPSRAQLNMHVNADEFFIRMYRGRYRSPSQRAPAPTLPDITTHPFSENILSGQWVSFAVVGKGCPTPAVQWQVSSDGTNFQHIPGATSATLMFVCDPRQSGNHFRAIFTNSVGEAVSRVGVLVVRSAPVITAQPVNYDTRTEHTAKFTADASGNPTPVVQWQHSTDGGRTFGDIPSATSLTYTFAAASKQNGNWFRAVFSNAEGTVMSDSARLTVTPGSSPPEESSRWGSDRETGTPGGEGTKGSERKDEDVKKNGGSADDEKKPT